MMMHINNSGMGKRMHGQGTVVHLGFLWSIKNYFLLAIGSSYVEVILATLKRKFYYPTEGSEHV